MTERVINRDINSRIQAICDDLFDGNATRMAKASFVSRTTLLSIMGEQQSAPGYETLRRIIDMPGPKININWLLTGQGQMLESDDSCEATYENVKKDTRPRIPISASAGYLSGIAEGVSASDCELTPVIPGVPDYTCTIIVRGDSMSPKYESGDELAIVQVRNREALQWGHVYILDTEDGVLLKRIYDEGNTIRCVSYNSDYPDSHIDKSIINSIWRVVALLRRL